MTKEFSVSFEDLHEDFYEENCRSCKYWASMPSRNCENIEGFKVYYYDFGFCKRYPPVIVENLDNNLKRFPSTRSDDYCGEYLFDRHYKVGVIHGKTPEHVSHLFDSTH